MKIIEKLNEEKKLFSKKENIYYFLLITAIFIFDRASKIEIIKNFSEEVYYLNNFLNIDLIWNIGIGFGLLSFDSELVYNSVTTIIGFVILILIYVANSAENSEKLIYTVIIGGALGNYYDRLTLNAVPDFIDLHYNEYHWFTFNIADIFITIGIIAFLFKGLLIKNK